MIKHPILVSFAVVGICIFLAAVILGLSGALNSFFFQVQKIDDATNYRTIKQVEDSCRAMISSYTADKLAYEQYKDSDSQEQQSWAAQAKMRANKTAASYNEYILKNSFIWQYNIPKDILQRLEYLK